MSATHCAALLAIVICVAQQGLGLSLQWHGEAHGACLQRHGQALVCLQWPPAVETPSRAG